VVLLRVLVLALVGGRLLPLVVVLLVWQQMSMIIRGKLLLMVLVGKEHVVLLFGLLSQMLVLVGDRPLPPVFMDGGLQLVVVQSCCCRFSRWG
jgi:hypothetical protein